MQLDSVWTVAREVARRMAALSGYVMTKRCRRCRHLLSKRAMVCPSCRKWQA